MLDSKLRSKLFSYPNLDIFGIYSAFTFAHKAHSAINHVRKYTGEPYINHPVHVLSLLLTYVPELTTEMCCAALLHDTVEDTEVTLNDIEFAFNKKTRDLVYWLTDVSKPEDGNRETRKEKDRRHIAKAPSEAQTIKIADLMSNTSSIVEHDLNFAAIYLDEKSKLLELLEKADPNILTAACFQLEDNLVYLDNQRLETNLLKLENCK